MTLFYIFCLEYSFASNTYWSLHWINDSYSKRYENVGDKFARLFFWRELFNIGIHFAFFENATIWSWGPTLNRIQQLAKGANMNVNELLYTRTFSFVCPLSKELWVRNSPEGNFWPTFSIWTTVGTQVIISLDKVSVDGKISLWTQNLITGDYF